MLTMLRLFFQLASSLATLLSHLRDAGAELSRLPISLPEIDPPPEGKEVLNSPDEEMEPDEV